MRNNEAAHRITKGFDESPEESALLSLLSASLFGTGLSYDSATDWDMVFLAAKMQTVISLVETSLPEELPSARRDQWKKAANAQIAKYVRYMSAEDELCRLFNEHSIPMAIIKGAAAAVYYPDPSRRMMGDVDFIVPKADLLRAKQLMLDAGYQHKSDTGGRHIAFYKAGFEFELHYHFSYPDLDIEKQIEEGFQNIVLAQLDGYSFPMLPRGVNGLILLAHIREHLRCGLGLRQVLDWMMFAHRELSDNIWQNEFGPLAKEKGLDTLAITLTRLCQLYLGLPENISWSSEADEDLCKQLMTSLLATGNFGRKKKAETLIGGVTTNIRRERLFPYLQRLGERDWKLYHQHRWLKPFAWIRESFVFIQKAKKLKLHRKQILTSLTNNEETYELLKKLKLL